MLTKTEITQIQESLHRAAQRTLEHPGYYPEGALATQINECTTVVDLANRRDLSRIEPHERQAIFNALTDDRTELSGVIATLQQIIYGYEQRSADLDTLRQKIAA